MTSHLGLFYIIGITVVMSGLFRILEVYLIVTTWCSPMSRVVLHDQHFGTSILHLIMAAFAALGVLCLIEIVSYIRSHIRRDLSVMLGYGFVLVWVIASLGLHYFWLGGMVRTGLKSDLFDATMNSQYVTSRFHRPDGGGSEGPLGTCPADLPPWGLRGEDYMSSFSPKLGRTPR